MAALLLPACGVPVDDVPRPVAGEELPGASAPQTLTGPLTTKAENRTIFLLDEGRLMRAVRAIDDPVGLPDVVTALLDGPTEDEVEMGLRSAIPPETELLSATIDGNIATLDFSSQFADVVGDAQRYSLAQVVWTATSYPGVDGVRIAIDEQLVQVPNADGQLVERPLTRIDFPPEINPTSAPIG
jgi:hypothetical protein